MAFDQATRGRLQRFVNDARRVLEEEFTRQLQNDYGLDPGAGTVAALASLRHINDAQRETARILRDTLTHYTAGGDMNTSYGLDRIVREQAFTVLNRLAALRMAEARGLLVESVGNGLQAKGFQLYARLAGTGLGETGDAYRVYLFSVFDEFAQDLPGLFDRHSPQGRLFPREAALLQVLSLINEADIAPLWSEDETIGWIYQYFNSKEERKAMRDASQAPRNSRELAVRNQFFTPRYVVEFLVDNTLGRLWFNATGGQTGLREHCQYLLVKPDEQPLAAKRLRDPRTLKLLDPACGSMHFGLYAFDLFLAIYREAWEWEQSHGPGSLDASAQRGVALPPLGRTYADLPSYLRDVPRLIIEHNIYGVDIDPRAAQIASLALWLRAQRAWHEDGLNAKDRPAVGRGHVVAATAPPAETKLREQMAVHLDGLDAALFTKTLLLLKSVPELGLLLQVEREVPRLVKAVFGEHGSLFKDADVEQWRKAEARLREALTEFAQAANATYQGRLFAQDALQGLRLIDLAGEAFDVLLMNPPFGLPASGAKETLRRLYPDAWTDYYNAFIERATQLVRPTGQFGAVVPDRLLYTKKSTSVRQLLSSSWKLQSLVDAGRDVMDDAAVDAVFFSAGHSPESEAIDCPVLDIRSTELAARPAALRAWVATPTASVDFSIFRSIPGNMFSYAAPVSYLKLWKRSARLDPDLATVATGGKTFDDARFLRLRWEVLPHQLKTKWATVDTGGDYQMWYAPPVFVQNWEREGAEIRSFAMEKHATDAQVMQSSKHWHKPGISYPYTSSIGFAPRILPAGTIFSSDAIAIHPKDAGDALPLLSLLASNWTSELLNCFGEGRKTENSLVKSLPVRIHDAAREHLAVVAKNAINSVIEIESRVETSPLFHSPFSGSTIEEVENRLKTALRDVDDASREAYGLPATSIASASNVDLVCSYVKAADPSVTAHAILSYLVGVSFNRWNIACSTGQLASTPLDDAFAELPPIPPGAVREVSYAEKTEVLSLDGDSDGLTEKVRLGMRTIFAGFSEQKELELCAALGCSSIEEYLRAPSGFFSVHLKSYSRGARRAPIYWPLATESGRFVLWAYYPGLTSQTLYTAVNNHVEPKLKLVRGNVTTLRDKGAARTRDDEKQLESLQTFERELIDLRDGLLNLAPAYKPNHDDGVQISAAPLWSLFRHNLWQKVLKETWTKLEKGDLDWAQQAMNYWPERVREKCKVDKSLAIAHRMEHLYVQPEATTKKARGRKKTGVAE